MSKSDLYLLEGFALGTIALLAITGLYQGFILHYWQGTVISAFIILFTVSLVSLAYN